MYRSILVPLDGSPNAEQAIPLAQNVARRADASIQLVEVHVPLTPYRDAMYSIDPILEDAMRASERAYLDSAVQRVKETKCGPVTSAFLEGPVADAILAKAVSQGVDLVVMTTHGRGPLSRFWLGSVADELVRRLPMPVLLVRSHEPEAVPVGEPVLQRILIPLDGSEFAEQVLEPAVAFAVLMGLEVTLLQVIAPVMPIESYALATSRLGQSDRLVLKDLIELQGQWEKEAQKYLAQVADRVRSRLANVQTQVVASDRPAAAILDEARAQHIDMIALATHGRGGVSRAFLGSVADKLLRGATMPILIYRPRAHNHRKTI